MALFLSAVILAFISVLFGFILGRRAHMKRAADQFYPFRRSDIQLFNDGPELFEKLFDDIKQAKRYIHMLFYIFRNDALGDRLLSLLKEMAEEGIEVRLLIDWAGSFFFPRRRIRELAKWGIEVVFCHVPRVPFFFYRLQSRNHRKITVIDGTVGYLGCFNVGKEYVNKNKKFSPWRDYHIRFTGEGAQDLNDQFLKDWEQATKKRINVGASLEPSILKGAFLHRFYSSAGLRLEEELINLFRRAKKEIVIGTPYFIPGKKAFKELEVALKRGVGIKVIVPKRSDHPFVKEGSYRFFRKLMPLGCSVFQFKRGFYHGKVLIIDDKICSVGTANFDRRSFYYNYEMNCFFYDERAVNMVRAIIEGDLKQSEPLTLERLSRFHPGRILKEAVAFLLSPLL